MSEIERCFTHIGEALKNLAEYLEDVEERLKKLENKDKYPLTCPKCKNIRLERFMSDCSDSMEKQIEQPSKSPILKVVCFHAGGMHTSIDL